MAAEAAIDAMKMRTTWLLLLAVGITAGIYWALEGGLDAEDRLRQETGRVFAGQPRRIQELVLERGGLRIECRKVEGVWRIVVPVNARADAAEMDRLLTVLIELRRGEVITAADRRDAQLSLADYGLDRPQAVLEWSDGITHRELRIGRISPVGNTMYVQVGGSDDIFAVPQTLLHIWPDSVVALRDRILFHGDPRRAYRAEVRHAGGVLHIQRGDDGVWRLRRPVTAAADSAAVRQWLDQLFDLRVVEFMADVISDPSVYQLDEAATQVTVWTDDQPAGQTLWLGMPIDADGELVFARRQDGVSVFAVPAEAQAISRVRPEHLRSRTLVPFVASAIDRIRLEYQGFQVDLERTHQQWHVRSPRQWRADHERVDQLLEAWTGARIEQFLDPPEAEEFADAFEPDSLRVRFSIREQPGVDEQQRWRDLELVVSDVPFVDNQILVQRNEEPSLYAVEGPGLDLSTARPLHFWDRQIIDLPEDKVRWVQQRIPGQEFAIDYADPMTISESSLEEGVLQADALRAAVRTLLTLQADELVVEQPEDWAVYGLDEPRIVWTVRLASESGIGRVLRMGNQRSDGRVYARTLGYNTLFLLNADDAERLSQPVVALPDEDGPSDPDETEDS